MSLPFDLRPTTVSQAVARPFAFCPEPLLLLPTSRMSGSQGDPWLSHTRPSLACSLKPASGTIVRLTSACNQSLKIIIAKQAFKEEVSLMTAVAWVLIPLSNRRLTRSEGSDGS